MASSSVTVTCDRGMIRKYGGTRGSVKGMRYWYEKMSFSDFLTLHPYLTEQDFKTMKLDTRFNKS